MRKRKSAHEQVVLNVVATQRIEGYEIKGPLLADLRRIALDKAKPEEMIAKYTAKYRALKVQQ